MFILKKLNTYILYNLYLFMSQKNKMKKIFNITINDIIWNNQYLFLKIYKPLNYKTKKILKNPELFLLYIHLISLSL